MEQEMNRQRNIKKLMTKLQRSRSILERKRIMRELNTLILD